MKKLFCFLFLSLSFPSISFSFLGVKKKPHQIQGFLFSLASDGLVPASCFRRVLKYMISHIDLIPTSCSSGEFLPAISLLTCFSVQSPRLSLCVTDSEETKIGG
ncbi:hypothetical protein L6452_24741 [Arctium lappa]|uniref:Uncharacterized protein n=1 Tax=Arctium lappa TaxID=4217 RepID=A0ACB9AAF5_ARCLA|nr:hypothetical protein L6452_24741 [Arctium lappa]